MTRSFAGIERGVPTMSAGICAVDDKSWSMVASAATNSQLAGVLAGFMIAVIAVAIFGSHRLDTHTVALFSSGVMALGLDSYLFSGITGSQPGSDSEEQICRVVWSQGMAASGLLAVGGSVFICGLGWMLAGHVAGGSPMLTKWRRIYLVRLAAMLTAGILATTTGLLVSTTMYYFRLLKFDSEWEILVPVYGAGVVLVSVISALIRSHAMVEKIKFVVPAKQVNTSLGLLPVSTFTVTGLAIASTLFSGILNLWVDDTNKVVIAIAVAVGLVIPGIVSILIAFSTPAPKNHRYC